MTNFGTGEHIKDQYDFFRNVHNLTRIGGAMVHVAPPVGGWQKHVCYYYYEKSFFRLLSRKIGYRIVFDGMGCGAGSGSPLICAVLVKKKGSFLDRGSFSLIKGIVPKQGVETVKNWGYKDG